MTPALSMIFSALSAALSGACLFILTDFRARIVRLEDRALDQPQTGVHSGGY